MQIGIKQKVILILTIIAFLFLGYQVYKLISGDVTQHAKVKQAWPQPQAATTAAAMPAVHESQDVAHAQLAGTVLADPKKSVAAPNNRPQATQQQPSPQIPLVKNQQAYLQMVNQYQLAKMKHQLLNEELAIADTQHQLLTVRQKTQQLAGGAAGDF